MPTQVSAGLYLVLRLENPQQMPELLAKLQEKQDITRAALQQLHYVHFARFVPSHDFTALQVITVFDGDLKSYVMDFSAVLGDVFNLILSYMRDRPRLPVQHHPEEFWNFVKSRHRDDGVWSAYPDKTVIDIVGPRAVRPQQPADATASPLDLADIQGNILRGYRATVARHFALTLTDARAAGRFLASLLDGDDRLIPQVSNALPWAHRPPSYCLTVGVTHSGLAALHVDTPTLRRFPTAFREGPADPRRAGQLGDPETSGWRVGGPDTPAHLLISLLCKTKAELSRRSAQLLGAFQQHGMTLVHTQDAQALPDGQTHFGFREGMGQPTVAGLPGKLADGQPTVPGGEFLLGAQHVNRLGGNFIGDLPSALCTNGTYAAYRLLRQDVAGFEALLDRVSRAHRLDRELVAAKLMGRWRSGDPLTLRPTAASRSVPNARQNDFDYVVTASHPTTSDDSLGLRCPVGSHVRRMNPRSSLVMGSGHAHRVIRRGMPYTMNGARRHAPERGLVGMFVCGDLESQFEFLMRHWANGDLAFPNVRGERDPILGAQPDGGGPFTFTPGPRSGPITITVPRLVDTVGSLYLFLPGLRGLRHLARMAQSGPTRRPKAASLGGFHPDRFDPRDPGFRADPYAAYAGFRESSPVHFVPATQTYWVFTHALVTDVCKPEAQQLFLKSERLMPRPAAPFHVTQHWPDGLFSMDPPEHNRIRPLLDHEFNASITHVGEWAREAARHALDATERAHPSRSALEWMTDFVQRVPLKVFGQVMGLPPEDLPVLDLWARSVMAGHDVHAAVATKLQAGTASMALRAYFQAVALAHAGAAGTSGCPVHTPVPETPAANGLFARMCALGHNARMSEGQVQQTALHFALGGYLSTEFLLTTGLYHLLRHPDQLRWLRDHPEAMGAAVHEMLRFDAPFQMADRVVAHDTELGGVKLRQGDRLAVVYGSANHDDIVFDTPERFDITRTPSALNYGLGHGIHSCIGQPMVHEVVPAALSVLLDRYAHLRLGEAGPWLSDHYFRSLQHLTVLTR